MAIDQITSGEILNSTIRGAKGSEKPEKSEKMESTSAGIKFVDKKSADKAEFKSQIASANREAASSRINSREDAVKLMKNLKAAATEKPENTLAVQANIAPDAALQLLQ